jgi:hypothetical protein
MIDVLCLITDGRDSAQPTERAISMGAPQEGASEHWIVVFVCLNIECYVTLVLFLFPPAEVAWMLPPHPSKTNIAALEEAFAAMEEAQTFTVPKGQYVLHFFFALMF